MLQSEVYRENPKIITSDLLLAMLGALETSRNITFMALCHLIKNDQAREKVRTEIYESIAHVRNL